jgi:hypothetical protein
MQLSFILMGTFLDDTAMLVIVAPLYVPLVGALGFDLIWYGVLYTITCQIAYMTPPFGYNLFLMRAMAPPEIKLRDIYRSDHSLCRGHAAGLGAGDDVSRKSRCGCRSNVYGKLTQTPGKTERIQQVYKQQENRHDNDQETQFLTKAGRCRRCRNSARRTAGDRAVADQVAHADLCRRGAWPST